jgi:TonB-dependent SusC/RagA subfamily outer membrane receptor
MHYRRSNLTSGITAFLAFILLPGILAAQTGQITGRVLDSEGVPLADVQISLENTMLGTLTNADGRYLLLNVPVGVYQVNAQRLGYASRHVTNVSVTNGGQAVVDFDMNTQVLTMEELIVTGTVDPIEGVKIPFTVGRVSTENMAVPTTNSALAALQGKVAGVSVVRGSGQPGSGVSILLRTPTSIESSNSPMFVVDGVILSSTIGGTTVDLESLDIESVEVVKGAAAASLYGSRAAAGVIQITTKRGSNLGLDQTQLKVRSEYGTNQLPHKIPVSNHHHYLQASNGDWLDLNGNVVPRDNRTIDPDNFMDNEYQSQLYDNFDNIFQPDRILLNTVSVAKNSQSTNFMASFTDYDERGNLPGNEGFQRRSFRLNVDHRIGDAFTISTSAFHSRSRQDDLDTDPFWALLIDFEKDINLAAKDSTGEYIRIPDPLLQSENPLWREKQTEDFDNNTRTLLSSDIRWRPMRGLSINGNVSYDRADRFNEYFGRKGIEPAPWQAEPSDGYMDHYYYQTQTMNGYIGATYTQAFGPLTVRPTVRAVMERESYQYTGAWVDGLAIAGVKDLDVGLEQNVTSSWPRDTWPRWGWTGTASTSWTCWAAVTAHRSSGPTPVGTTTTGWRGRIVCPRSRGGRSSPSTSSSCATPSGRRAGGPGSRASTSSGA